MEVVGRWKRVGVEGCGVAALRAAIVRKRHRQDHILVLHQLVDLTKQVSNQTTPQQNKKNLGKEKRERKKEREREREKERERERKERERERREREREREGERERERERERKREKERERE